MDMKLLLNWRLHLTVILASLLAEWIGILRIPLGPGTLLLLPLFYAFIIGVLFNPHLFSSMQRVIPKPVSNAAGPLIILELCPAHSRDAQDHTPARQVQNLHRTVCLINR